MFHPENGAAGTVVAQDRTEATTVRLAAGSGGGRSCGPYCREKRVRQCLANDLCFAHLRSLLPTANSKGSFSQVIRHFWRNVVEKYGAEIPEGVGRLVYDVSS